MATESDKRPSRFSRLMHRLTASEAELDAEELQRGSKESGSTPASGCRRGQVVSVTGRLRTVVYTPRTKLPTLEAELYDGSDLITLVWLGRRHIAGIEPGRAVFFFQAEDGIRDLYVTGVQTCALPILGVVGDTFMNIDAE